MHPYVHSSTLTIVKTWKQPKCPLTDEWIKKMWCMYTMDYYSAIKKKERMPFAATRMQLEIKGALLSFQVHLICGLL